MSSLYWGILVRASKCIAGNDNSRLSLQQVAPAAPWRAQHRASQELTGFAGQRPEHPPDPSLLTNASTPVSSGATAVGVHMVGLREADPP